MLEFNNNDNAISDNEGEEKNHSPTKQSLSHMTKPYETLLIIHFKMRLKVRIIYTKSMVSFHSLHSSSLNMYDYLTNLEQHDSCKHVKQKQKNSISNSEDVFTKTYS